MSTPPTPAKANEPLVTDEWIDDRVDEYKLAYRTQITIVVKEVRELYEADRTKLLADLAAMRKAAVESHRLLDKLQWPCDYARHTKDEEHLLGVCPIEKAIAIHIVTLESMLKTDVLTPPRNG